MNGKAMRDLERGLHITVGVLLLVMVFTPLGEGGVGAALRLGLVPLLTGSGLLMWQHRKVTKLLRRRPSPALRREGRLGRIG